MCEAAYGTVGLDWREHVASDPSFVRTTETVAAVADASKARAQLGWTPSVGFRDMLADMVTAHLDRLSPALTPDLFGTLVRLRRFCWIGPVPEARMVPFFVQIKCQLGKSYEVANALADAEIASEIYSTAGDFDLLVKFYVDAGTDIGHFVNEKVQTIPGIQDTRTIITFKAF